MTYNGKLLSGKGVDPTAVLTILLVALGIMIYVFAPITLMVGLIGSVINAWYSDSWHTVLLLGGGVTFIGWLIAFLVVRNFIVDKESDFVDDGDPYN